MPADIKLLKAALEDAKFDDPVVREKIYSCINSLSDDLIEVNFSASLPTDQLFDDLEMYLNESESEADEVVVESEDEEEDDDGEEEYEDDDEDDDDDDDEEEEGIVLGDDNEDNEQES